MEGRKHIIVSLAIGVAIFLYYKSITYGIISFLVGVLIDIDHLFDYFREIGYKLDIKRFISFCYERKFKKLYLFFHSYEIPILLLVFEIYFRESIFIVILISWLQHLLFDQFTNYARKFGYFFLYRLKFNFSPQKILKYP